MWPKELTLQSTKKVPHFSLAVPGSKSYTNRALLIAALAKNQSKLLGASLSSDSLVMIEALKKLGLDFKVIDSEVTITPPSNGFKVAEGNIDIGAAGTSMRFLTALFASALGSSITLLGSERMHTRPIGDLVTALKTLGADISYTKNSGCPPLKITGKKLSGGNISISGSASSQFISALLMVSPTFSSGLNLNLKGDLVSQTYIAMTLETMRHFGVKAETKDMRTITVPSNSEYTGREYQVEGDASGASYLFGIAALSGTTLNIKNIMQQSLQGDAKFPELLSKMGCKVTYGDGISVTGTEKLLPIECDMTEMPVTAQTLAVIAAFAQGKTKITGLSTLKHKETDRLLALKTELSKVGVRSEIGDSWIEVYGGSPTAGKISTYEDHRMAMSFSMLASRVEGITIEDPKVVEKSFPNFFEVIKQLGIE